MSQDEGREYGWDETIDNPDEGDYTIWPDGTYKFMVTNFEKERYTPAAGAKLPPCNCAVMSLRFEHPELGEMTLKHKLFLHSKCTGMLSQFFKAIGLRKSGDPLVFKWNEACTQEGYAKLSKKIYDGKEFQQIKSFIMPEDWPSQSQGQQTYVNGQQAPTGEKPADIAQSGF